MINRILLVFILFLGLQTFGQKITYLGNGNISDSNSVKITPEQVEALLKDNDDLLRSYVGARSKKSVGNIMLYGGLAMVATDLAIMSNQETKAFSLLTLLGGITTLIGIPVKMGFSKKIKNVVNEYNSKNGYTYNYENDPKLEVITNNFGLGMRLSFN